MRPIPGDLSVAKTGVATASLKPYTVLPASARPSIFLSSRDFCPRQSPGKYKTVRNGGRS